MLLAVRRPTIFGTARFFGWSTKEASLRSPAPCTRTGCLAAPASRARHKCSQAHLDIVFKVFSPSVADARERARRLVGEALPKNCFPHSSCTRTPSWHIFAPNEEGNRHWLQLGSSWNSFVSTHLVSSLRDQCSKTCTHFKVCCGRCSFGLVMDRFVYVFRV